MKFKDDFEKESYEINKKIFDIYESFYKKYGKPNTLSLLSANTILLLKTLDFYEEAKLAYFCESLEPAQNK